MVPNAGLLKFTLVTMVSLTGCMSVLPMMAPTVKAETPLSSTFPFESKYANALGSRMHYIDTGTGKESGTPLLFVHGNPTSSYLWRNVIPQVSGEHRAIAVDLIGMGKSDKPDLEYHLEDHVAYFEAFVESLGLEKVVLVVHDWGGPIGFAYARKHADKVAGIVLMETLVRPMKWDEMDGMTTYMFKKFRDPVEGKTLLVDENYFVEKMLPMMAGRTLTAEEMNVYRAPFTTAAARKPVATWPSEIPIDAEPKRNQELVGENFAFLESSQVPLLLLRGKPGMIMTDALVADLQKALPRMQVKDIGPGMHFLQETQPTHIGQAIAEWTAQLH